MLFLQAEEYQ